MPDCLWPLKHIRSAPLLHAERHGRSLMNSANVFCQVEVNLNLYMGVFIRDARGVQWKNSVSFYFPWHCLVLWALHLCAVFSFSFHWHGLFALLCCWYEKSSFIEDIALYCRQLLYTCAMARRPCVSIIYSFGQVLQFTTCFCSFFAVVSILHHSCVQKLPVF